MPFRTIYQDPVTRKEEIEREEGMKKEGKEGGEKEEKEKKEEKKERKEGKKESQLFTMPYKSIPRISI